MNAEEKLEKADFRKQNESDDSCCLLCDYYELINPENIRICKLHQVKFEKEFSAKDYGCNDFDGSIVECLVETLLMEGNSQ